MQPAVPQPQRRAHSSRRLLRSVGLCALSALAVTAFIGPSAGLRWARAANAAEAAEERAARSLASACSLRYSKRVFVGFGLEMGVADFEGAAVQAERMMRAARPQLCAKNASPLGTALSNGTPVNITNVQFADRELRAASLVLRAPHDALRWLVRMTRVDEAWSVVFVQPQALASSDASSRRSNLGQTGQLRDEL